MLPKKPKMSFVMPAYKSANTIRQALESLFDQDYKNFEVIVCLDGPDPDIHEELKKFFNNHKEPDNLFVIKTEKHSGACSARNEGAKMATGDLISFFSSDFIAEPGMLRRWIDVFNENPDADFVYGGYKFWDDRTMTLESEEYNPYILTCYNYIDGGFPLKMDVYREHKWDAQFKSLNDWAFWLDIALCPHGHKGVFIPDFSYSAQTPQPGGLSYDSANNWQERVAQVKRKYGIPDRAVCFCSLEYENEAKQLAQQMGADYNRNPGYKPHNYKLIYQIGFHVDAADVCASMFLHGENTKKVIHWMPMDIRKLKQKNVATLEALARAFQLEGFISYACTNADVTFLNLFGFNAKLKYYYATTAYNTNGHLDTVVWFPPELADIRKGLPDIKTTDNRREATVDVLFNTPWSEVAESLMEGKCVIGNIPYPGVHVIHPESTYPELRASIIEAIRGNDWSVGRYAINTRKLCSERVFRKELQRLCK